MRQTFHLICTHTTGERMRQCNTQMVLLLKLKQKYQIATSCQVFLWHCTDIHVVVLLHRSIFMSNLLRSCTLTRISDIVQVHVNKESLH